jgi:hypothetical protein
VDHLQGLKTKKKSLMKNGGYLPKNERYFLMTKEPFLKMEGLGISPRSNFCFKMCHPNTLVNFQQVFTIRVKVCLALYDG